MQVDDSSSSNDCGPVEGVARDDESNLGLRMEEEPSNTELEQSQISQQNANEPVEQGGEDIEPGQDEEEQKDPTEALNYSASTSSESNAPGSPSCETSRASVNGTKDTPNDTESPNEEEIYSWVDEEEGILSTPETSRSGSQESYESTTPSFFDLEPEESFSSFYDEDVEMASFGAVQLLPSLHRPAFTKPSEAQNETTISSDQEVEDDDNEVPTMDHVDAPQALLRQPFLSRARAKSAFLGQQQQHQHEEEDKAFDARFSRYLSSFRRQSIKRSMSSYVSQDDSDDDGSLVSSKESLLPRRDDEVANTKSSGVDNPDRRITNTAWHYTSRAFFWINNLVWCVVTTILITLLLMVAQKERQEQDDLPLPDVMVPTQAPTAAMIGRDGPTSSSVECFTSRGQLLLAIQGYLDGGPAQAAWVHKTYGARIGNWCVSGVSNFDRLFYGRSTFNEPLDGWDMSNAVSTREMFRNAIGFNQNVGSWNLSAAQDLSGMFRNATAFVGNGLSAWNVSSAVYMEYMFAAATALTDADLSMWNVHAVTSMQGMFAGATAVQGTGLSNWNTSALTNMAYTFAGASALVDVNFSAWDVGRVTNMTHAFAGATALVGHGLEHWNVSAVTDLSFLFYRAVNLNIDVSNWDVSAAIDLQGMFGFCRSFSGSGVGAWNISSAARNLAGMFLGATEFDDNLSGWNVSSVVDMSHTFAGTAKFQGLGLEHWNVSRVTSLQGTFDGARALVGHNLALWDTSRVTNMHGTFDSALRFEGDVSRWNTSRVVDMTALFRRAIRFDGNLSAWDVSNVVDMTDMFHRAAVFQGKDDSSSLVAWDVKRVVSMRGMFQDARSFTGTGLSTWNVSSLVDMQDMFRGAVTFAQDLCSWKLPHRPQWIVAGAFDGTACPTASQEFNSTAGGPLCFACTAAFTLVDPQQQSP